MRLLDGHHVDGRGGRRVLEGQYGHVVRLALAADDEGDASAVAFATRQNARRGPALALLQQLDLALLHLGAAARLDRPHIGVVDPCEAAVLAAQPNGDGQRVEQRAAGAHFAREALVLGEDARDLVAMAGDVAEAQHGASAGRAPLGFDVAAGEVRTMMLNGWPEVNSASRAGFSAAAELGSSHWPKRRNFSGLSGRPGMPFSVWATTRRGWFCSQNSRICGSERIMNRRRRGCA